MNAENIPEYFYWIAYVSPFKYSFTALVQNEFEGLKLYCKEWQYTEDSNGELRCPIEKGEQVLQLYGLDDSFTIGECIAILAAIIVGLRILGYLALRFVAKK